MQTIKTFLAASLVLALAACGGGGGTPADTLSLGQMEVTGTPASADNYTQDTTNPFYAITGTGPLTARANGVGPGTTPTKSVFMSMTFTGNTLNTFGLQAGATASPLTYSCGVGNGDSPCSPSSFVYNATSKTVRVEGLKVKDSSSNEVTVNTLFRVL